MQELAETSEHELYQINKLKELIETSTVALKALGAKNKRLEEIVTEKNNVITENGVLLEKQKNYIDDLMKTNRTLVEGNNTLLSRNAFLENLIITYKNIVEQVSTGVTANKVDESTQTTSDLDSIVEDETQVPSVEQSSEENDSEELENNNKKRKTSGYDRCSYCRTRRIYDTLKNGDPNPKACNRGRPCNNCIEANHKDCCTGKYGYHSK